MEEKIALPEKVNATVKDRTVTVEGPKGRIGKTFDDARYNDAIDIRVNGNEVVVTYDPESRKVGAVAGTIRTHIKNMVHGVTEGYEYTLKIVYTHFPITVSAEKGEVHIKNFLGEKGSRKAKIINDSHVQVDKETVAIKGIDKDAVSQTAANIEQACRISKRDRRIFQDGIYMEKIKKK